MEIISHKMPVNFNLFPIGDTHLGTLLCHENGIKQFVESMHEGQYGLKPSANFWMHGGDTIEAITVDDRRYDLSLAKHPLENIQRQADDFIKLFWSIRKKCLGVHKGNHEQKLMKVMNFAKYIAKELGAPYATWSAVYQYLDHKGELMFKHFATHGARSITSTADDPKRRLTNMELILKRQMKFKMGDTLLMTKGHTHKLLICRPNKELYLASDVAETYNSVEKSASAADGFQTKVRHIRHKYTHSHRAAGYIHPDHRWYVNTGAFYKLHVIGDDGYAERAEYDPIELAYPVVLVRDRKITDIKKIPLE